LPDRFLSVYSKQFQKTMGHTSLQGVQPRIKVGSQAENKEWETILKQIKENVYNIIFEGKLFW
jgi:hypothetical protein